MSSSLDALGWKKVLIDMRKEMPIGLSIPSLTTPKLTKSGGARDGDGPPLRPSCSVQKLKSHHRVVESRHLAKAISSSFSGSNRRIILPLGHNALPAISGSGGKYVMDSLASELTTEISLWAGHQS